MKAKEVCDIFQRVGSKFEKYSLYRPTPLNLKTLLEFGMNAPASKSFSFIRKELPVRLANIMQEVRLLPPSLLRTDSLKALASMYESTFETVLKYETCDINRPSFISDFTEDLREIHDRHSSVVALMASGIKEISENSSLSADTTQQLQYFLDRFYISRIGIRMLINQHILLYGPILREHRSHVGCIDPDCSPLQLVISAYAYARLMCLQVYGRAPGCDIEVYDTLSPRDKQSRIVITDASQRPSGSERLFENLPNCDELSVIGTDFTFCYIPGHLFHILFELTKNAMRAVVENPESKLKRLHVVICNSSEDVTIKMFDFGGGMSRNVLEQAFKYTFTTASHLASTQAVPSYSSERIIPDEAKFSPIAGRGHGLPLSRLHARYLGGDLKLTSVEGFGSWAHVYLRRRPETANELLPLFNRTARAAYTCHGSVWDWISGPSHRYKPFPPDRPNIRLA